MELVPRGAWRAGCVRGACGMRHVTLGTNTAQDLSHSYVSDDGIRTATVMLPKLTHIELSSCRYVTAKTVSILETNSSGMC
jgi:hypothetical protein